MENLPNEKNMLTILEAREKLRFKQEWKTFANENEQAAQTEDKPLSIKPPLRVWNVRKYLAVASITLLLSFSGFKIYEYLTKIPDSYMALAKSYDIKFDKPHLNHLRSVDQTTVDIKSIQFAYAKDAYATVLQNIEQAYPDAIEIPDKILQIRAFSYYQTGAYQEAIQDFEQFIANAQLSSDDALWFSALAYLKNEPPLLEKAIINLETLIRNYDSKDVQAEQLLDDLQRMGE